MDSIKNIGFLLFAAFLHAAFLYSVWGALRSIFASFWPRVKGEVTYAGIDEEYDSEGSTFSPVIEYTYRVGGKVYTSKNFAYGFVPSGFKFLSSSIQKKYRNMPYVNVYYNPKKHSRSVLMVGIRSFHLLGISVIALFLYVFIYRPNL